MAISMASLDMERKMTVNRITLNPTTVARVLGAVIVFLLLASIAGQVSKYWFGHDQVYGLVPLFYVDEEQNLPTLFSVCLLLFAASLLAVITTFERRRGTADTSKWATLTFGFLFMGIDEFASFHEKLTLPVGHLMGTGPLGVFYYAWVIPGVALVVALGLYFVGFLWRLSPGTRYAFLAAAMVYLGGAIGFELVGGVYVKVHGQENLTYSMISTIEEGLEMIGVTMFIRALMKYIAENHGEIQLRIEGERQSVIHRAPSSQGPKSTPEGGVAARQEFPQEESKAA